MKNTAKIILTVIGILLLINSAVLALFINFNFGTVITFAFGAAFLIYGIWFENIIHITSSGILRQVKYGIYLFFIFMLCVILFIAFYGTHDTVTYKEDALIVLGAGIRGEVVTLPLAYRLEKAVDYSFKNPESIIIVSGGMGPQESITEALAMERYLIKRGISKDKIIKEEKATSTYENFLYSKEILDGYFTQPYKTAFITNNFHIYRASRLAKIVGLEAAHFNAKLEWYTIPINYLREFTAILKLWVLGR